jgi:hypothetical protein
MATIKGTTVDFGIASNATTGFAGEVIVTSASGGSRAETKQIKDSAGEAMSYVVFDESKEVSVDVVCAGGTCSVAGYSTNATCVAATGTWTASTADIGDVGDVITLANFSGGSNDLNGAYYMNGCSLNYSNESEMTASLTLLRLEDAAFTGSGKDLA